MKRIIFAMAMLACFTAAFAAKQTTHLYVPEMECMNCQGKVEKVLAFEKGVRGLEFDLEKRMVTITYEDKRTDVAKLQEALVKHLKYKSEVVDPEHHNHSGHDHDHSHEGHNH